MKTLSVLFFFFTSLSLFAQSRPIFCEMVSVQDHHQTTSVVLEPDRNGYAYDYTTKLVDGLYGFTAEVEGAVADDTGMISININDGNDDVAEVYCDISNKINSNIICSEPVYRDGVLSYAVNCGFFNKK